MAKGRADGKKTRARVLKEALPLFAEHGFAGTSIRMVSKAAKVNVATLAYHFRDKEGLYSAVVQTLHHELAERFPETPPSGDPDAILRWYVESAWVFCKEHRIHNRLLLRHVLDRGEIPEIVQKRWTDMLMDRATLVIQVFQPDWTLGRIRLLILSFQFLVVRFSLEIPGQVQRALGEDVDLDEEIVNFLDRTLRLHLGLPVTS